MSKNSRKEQSGEFSKLAQEKRTPLLAEFWFFLKHNKKWWLLPILIILLLLGSAGLGLFRMVPLKLLPFDNKNEFQIVLDMPEGTTLEGTDRVVRSFEDYLRKVPEVTSIVSYVGTASPMDFNGLVRHYYLLNYL